MSPDQIAAADASSQEEWRPIEHYEGLYSVSSLGRVRSEDRVVTTRNGGRRFLKGRLLSYNTNNRGVLFVTLSWKCQPQSLLVHDLVARAFLGPKPEGLVVKHGPGGRTDNRRENLSYGLPMDGHARSQMLKEIVPRGERHWGSKLDEKAVRLIRSLPRDRDTVSNLAKVYGVSSVAIRNVIRRRSWTHVA